jgi:hypothetical protein
MLVVIFFPTITYSSVTVHAIDGSHPSIHLIQPVGGEKLSGEINITWTTYNADDVTLQIYIFYSNEWNNSWRSVTIGLEDSGKYFWSTENLSDGAYQLKIEAVTSDNYIAFDTSDFFIVDNNNSNIIISDITIRDKTIDSYAFVKNHDVVNVTATISGGNFLSSTDITANLSGLGESPIVHPESFDGATARWTVSNVCCTPLNGEVTISVDVKNIDTKIASIIADNTLPLLSIDKPAKGFYIFNHKIISLRNTIVIGFVDVEVNASDINGIEKIKYFVNDMSIHTVTDPSETWRLNMRLFGQQKLAVFVYDAAGNIASVGVTIKIFNFLGCN